MRNKPGCLDSYLRSGFAVLLAIVAGRQTYLPCPENKQHIGFSGSD